MQGHFDRHLPTSLRLLTAVAWLGIASTGIASTGGCAAAFEKSRVASRFETLFGCQDPQVRPTRGGYRVTGCGVAAHFQCFHTQDRGPRDSEQSIAGRLLYDIFVKDAVEPQHCVLEHTERRPERMALAPKVTQGKRGRLRARLAVTGGSVELLAEPERFGTSVGIALQSTYLDAREGCELRLYRDGEPITLHRTRIESPRRVLLQLEASALRELHTVQRFAGAICGLELDFDEDDRRTLSLLETRVREELDRLSRAHATAGGAESP